MIFHGEVAPGFESVRDAFVEGHASDPGAAQLCVYREGERVVDLWTGRDPGSGKQISGDSPTVLWSVTKGLMAVVVAQLVERGDLDPEALVTDYWPEYGTHGKEATRVWHLLSHSAGLPLFPRENDIVPADVADHDRLARALAGGSPLWTPGTASFYHAFTYGPLVDEVVRRATGRSTAAHFADRVVGPLGIELWMAGMPPEREAEVTHRPLWNDNPLDVPAEWGSHGVDLTDPVVDRLAHPTPTIHEWVDFFNTPEGHSVEFGSAGGIASARAVATVYAACLAGGVNGVELFGDDTRAAVTRSRTRSLGPVPPLAPLPRDREMEFGLGFMIGSPFVDERFREGGTFGHPGAGGNFGWAHPATRSSVGYTCTSMWADSATTDPRLPWVAALAEVLGA